ncbi:MAG: DUF4173 domain-containing protein [Anaeromicrobium sp.]|uniref:DUF4153 domain-containing protein n=1 Tax=Anaeromicrobium sp. TaxID=1929132 RepID=UPI0025D387C2|nr:DUF4173 domain-containing protein [Anaeromicrobium sp.]MCT4595336.1 DUF4173 domain-containing protein [Anaeromicrobium sp.]
MSIDERLKIIFIGIIMGVIFNYFFVDRLLGISVVMYVCIFLSLTIWTIRKEEYRVNKFSWVLLLSIILLCLSFGIYNNEVLNYINMVLIPLLIVSYLCIISYEEMNILNFNFLKNILKKITVGSVTNSYEFTDWTIEHSKEISKKSKNNTIYRGILKGILISCPLLIIIIKLLSSADMVFAYYTSDIYEGVINMNRNIFFIRTLVFLLVSLYTIGFIANFKYEYKENINKKIINIKLWEPITLLTIIFFISIVYGLFTSIQFSYLYGGVKNVLPGGLSHASYARRGFFELIFVTLINFVILMLFMKFSKKDNEKLNKLMDLSYSVLVVFTCNMLVSAAYKMALYEERFGYTRLRLFVESFMALLGLVLVILLLSIWIKKIPLCKSVAVCTLIVYISLNFMNVDKIIAKKNIERYDKDYGIDMGYMASLSCDATEEIEVLLKSQSILVVDGAKKCLKIIDNKTHKGSYWYEYNYYKNKLEKVMKNI